LKALLRISSAWKKLIIELDGRHHGFDGKRKRNAQRDGKRNLVGIGGVAV
jgi:very-short-patch-repair endonuclease